MARIPVYNSGGLGLDSRPGGQPSQSP